MKAFNNGEFESHKAEVQAKWGNTAAYKEHAEKTKGYGKDQWNSLAAEMDVIFGEFAVCMKNGTAPDANETQTLVKKLQEHITENYYHCTTAILSGLGQMYVADERFRNNIDKHADGTAAYVCEAIMHYSNQ